MAKKLYSHFNAHGELVSLPFDQCPPSVRGFIVKQKAKRAKRLAKVRKEREARALARRNEYNPLNRR